MFKFFRNIRRSLLSSNKVSKYLIYAIGEVLLVMVGILLALQVNNWNEEKKDREEESLILEQLKKEYENNLSQLEEKIAMRKKMILFSSDILRYIDEPHNVEIDSLVYKLGELGTDPTFDPIKNDLISSGKIRLIQNDKLSKLLSNWSSDIVALQEMEEYWKNVTLSMNLPLLNELGVLRDALQQYWTQDIPVFVLDKTLDYSIQIGKSKKILDPIAILNHPDLEGIVANSISYNHLNNLQSISLKKRIIEILELLNSEID